MRKRIAVVVLLAALVALGLPAAIAVIYAQNGFRVAQELAAHQLWPHARERLGSYLWLHPNDGHALLLMAEAFARDDALPADEAATKAIDHLARIPDSSPLAAEARLRESSLCFLILQKPGRAEQLARQAVDLGGGLPAYRLLWTLLNATGRSEDTEAIFWRAYELCPDDERPLVLREWYMSQFFPLTANESLDRRIGILVPQETPTRTSESRRYLRFREREPESVANHVAVAQWCQEERDPEFAIRLLDAVVKELPAAKRDPFFLSVTIATQLDLGQFEDAAASFRQWPESDRGHAYWKWRAIVLDDVLHEQDEAIKAYDRACELWPGPADWRLHHRRAGCLSRSRKSEAAAAMGCVEHVKSLMTPETHDRLRAALGSLGDPEQLTAVVKFYRQLGRDREADAWEVHIQRLRMRVAQGR
jgi:tetratricopeptide (TPR) repeat protein